jgi:hypothetical protein
MALNKTVKNIRLTREDLSDYVYHFTKDASAYETLVKIIEDGALKDMSNKGVICFTEAPFPMLMNMFDIFRQYDNPMYAPYGIAIKKITLFELGGRPVIYGSNSEKCLLHSSIQWRFQPYHPVNYDYSWLREWRVPLSEVKLNCEDSFILTNKEDELMLGYREEDLIDIEPDVDVDSNSESTMYMYGKIPRHYKGISVEKLREIDTPTNAAMADILLSQSFTDMQYVYLGVYPNDKL